MFHRHGGLIDAGPDEAGADDADLHPQIGCFDAQRQGQPDDGVLAGVVGALNGPGSSPADDEVLTMWRIPAGS